MWFPNCLQYNKLFTVIHLCSLLYIILSSIFEKHGSIHMGRWFIINEVSPDLKTGVTLAIFILSGKVPFLRDKSEIHFNGTNKELKFCFTMS